MDTTSGAALFHPLIPESTTGNSPVFRMEDLEANTDFRTKVLYAHEARLARNQSLINLLPTIPIARRAPQHTAAADTTT